MIPDILKPLLNRPRTRRINLFEDDPMAPGKPRPRTPGILPDQRAAAPSRTARDTSFDPYGDPLSRLIREKRGIDEVIAENARTVNAALKTADHRDLAKVHATAVRDFGDPALAEVADFHDQLHKANPRAAQSWLTAMKKELPAETDRMEKGLKQIEKEDADEKALMATNDDLRDALGTGKSTKRGEVEVAAGPLVLPVALASLPLLVGAGIVTQQNADEIAAAAKAGQRWAIDKLGELFGRTAIADPLPTTETFPEDKPDPKLGKETFPQADPMPPLPPSEKQAVATGSEALPDQSDEFDDLSIMHYRPLDRPYDFEDDDPPSKSRNKIGQLGPERSAVIEEEAFKDGHAVEGDGRGINIDVDRPPSDRMSDMENIIIGLEGDGALDRIEDHRSTEDKREFRWTSDDGRIEIIVRGSEHDIPTLDIHIKSENGKKAHQIEKRYRGLE